MVDIKDLIFPMPDLIWDETDFIEELIWIPFPSQSFESLIPIYNDQIFNENDQFLEENKAKFEKTNRYILTDDNKLMRKTVFGGRKTYLKNKNLKKPTKEEEALEEVIQKPSKKIKKK